MIDASDLVLTRLRLWSMYGDEDDDVRLRLDHAVSELRDYCRQLRRDAEQRALAAWNGER